MMFFVDFQVKFFWHKRDWEISAETTQFNNIKLSPCIRKTSF